MNDLFVGDEKLISTPRAAELTSYSKDYIGQLCREEKIECRRVSGNWYVDESSLKRYQETGIGVSVVPTEDEPDEEVKKVAPHGMKVGNVRDDTFKYDGVEYIATSRAADITGYAQDYVGQLARDGEVQARKVGRRWFVDKAALLKHKKHNDSLLANVQAEASGIRRSSTGDSSTPEHLDVESSDKSVGVRIHTEVEPGDINFNVRYFTEPVHTFPQSTPVIEQAAESVPIQTPQTQTYAPRDISSPVPIIKRIPTTTPGQMPAVGRDEIAVRKPLKQSPSREEKSVSVLPPKPEQTYHYEEQKAARSHLGWLLYTVPLLIVGVGAATFAYFYGIPEIQLNSVLSTETIDMLSENYGEIFPGKNVTYTAE